MLRAEAMDTARFDHLIFVCTNERDPSDARGCCAARGSLAVLDRLKALTQEHKLKGKVRATPSGCLDFCAKGCTVVVFSRESALGETWYTHVTPADADELFTCHVLEGKRLERLWEKTK
jgi:(2Fe-2S) ferredoxin